MDASGELRFLDAYGERWLSLRDFFHEIDLVIASPHVRGSVKAPLRELKQQVASASATAISDNVEKG